MSVDVGHLILENASAVKEHVAGLGNASKRIRSGSSVDRSWG
jgi:hypothetical protein